MNYLYHGSTVQNIKTLEPRQRFVPAGKISYKAIYATPFPAFAAAQGFPWSSDEGIDVDEKDGKIILLVPKDLKGRLLTPISIYKVSADGFSKTKEENTGLTWHTIKPTSVLEEVKYLSVIDAIDSSGGKIIYT